MLFKYSKKVLSTCREKIQSHAVELNTRPKSIKEKNIQLHFSFFYKS